MELVAIQEGDCQQERLGLTENVERVLGGAWGLQWPSKWCWEESCLQNLRHGVRALHALKIPWL